MKRALIWVAAAGFAVVMTGAIVRKRAKAARAHEEARIDEALDESFPASDPPSW